MICRGQKTNAHGKMPLCRVSKKALGKDAFCRVPKNKLGKMPLCRVSKKGTRQRRILPSAEKWHSAKYIFVECQKKALGKDAECQKKALGKDAFCRVPKNGTRQNTSLPSARKKALAECRKMALGKVHLKCQSLVKRLVCTVRSPITDLQYM